MHSIPLFFIIASLASTSLGLQHLAVTARRSFDIILARQTSGPCAPVCNSVQSTVTACGASISCICTSAIAANVQACVNCAVGASPSVSVIDSAEGLIEAFETTCSSAGIPSVTINTNGGTPQSTPNTATLPSTTPVSVTTTVPTTRSQVVIGPSSATSAPNTSLSVGSTSASTASIGGLPLKSSAFTNTDKIDFHWTVALLGLAVGNLLVF